jgi:hypothetical protein
VVLCIVVILSVGVYFALNKSVHVRETMSTSSPSNNMIDNIDVVYYINLDHRLDRKTEFLSEMEKMNYPTDKIVRISGVYDKERGHLGCSLSHIKTLQQFIESPHKNCIVFEDDFEFIQDTQTINALFGKFFDNNIDYDVCMLSANAFDIKPIHKYDFIKKVNYAQTTSGYMLSKRFAPILLANFKEGIVKLKQSYDEGTPENSHNSKFAVDQYWGSLMPYSKWYLFEPKMGDQRVSFSDIMGDVIDNNV